MTRLTHRPRRGAPGAGAGGGSSTTAGTAVFDAPEGSSRSPGNQPGSVPSANNVIAWVYRLIVKTDLEMEMRPGAEPGAALKADPLALRHPHAIADGKARHVPVEAGEPVLVNDDHVVPVARVTCVGVGDPAVGGVDLSTVGPRDV